MPQTMLALLAMMVATLFAVQQQRNVVHSQFQMIRNEVAMQATAIAADRLEEIGAEAYDEATVGDTRITSASQLTLEADFRSDKQGNDIDDFYSVPLDTFRVMQPTAPDPDTLWFRVLSTVSYAQESDPEQPVSDPSLRTKFKKVTVKAYSLTISHPDTVSISQSYACGSLCDWN